ncbi:MAG TPA: protein tyrosine phosphatase family protein [Acidobacteriota bacterium]|nr:protein tyrosine phosphatase family protein [Acidobacteriota bacterium]
MTTAKGVFSVILFCFVPAVLRGQEAAGKPPADLPRYFELTPRIGTGGQPTNSGFRLLAEKGYQAVVNLRTADEGVDLAAEERLVKELGLKYYSVPVFGKEPRDEQAVAFLKAMKDVKDERVFVHCAAANRVGGLMIIWRVLKDGIRQEKAEDEAREVGLRSDSLLKFARDFISRQPQ